LQEGAGFVGVDVNVLAALDRGADDAERGSVTASGECAGVAMGKDSTLVRQKCCAVCAHRLAGGDVFPIHGMSFFKDLFLDLDERGARAH